MIKSTTVIKRMIGDSWRSVLSGAAFMASVGLGGYLAHLVFGWDPYFTSMYLLSLSMFIWGVKGWYDWKKETIQMEQEQMLRDMGKKND